MSLEIESLKETLSKSKVQLESLTALRENQSESDPQLEAVANELQQSIESLEKSILQLRKAEVLRKYSSNPSPDVDHANQSSPDFSVGSICEVEFHNRWHRVSVIRVDNDGYSVMFCHPQSTSMKKCRFFGTDRCHYGPDLCKFSHGYKVGSSQIRVAPELNNSSSLGVDSPCLALFDEDGLWYPATIITINASTFTVKYVGFGDEMFSVSKDDVIDRIVHSKEESSEDADSGSELPVSLGDTPQMSSMVSTISEFQSAGNDFCSWSRHTSGFGLKLLEKSGYTFGKGLGKNGQGRVHPVDARIIKGRNTGLDFVSEHSKPATKPGTGKSAKRRERKRERTAKIEEEREVQRKKSQRYDDVFDFMNVNLSKRNDSVESDIITSGVADGLSKRAVSQHSDKSLRIKLQDQISALIHQRDKLLQCVSRHSGLDGDNSMLLLYSEKLKHVEKKLSSLTYERQSREKKRKSKRSTIEKFEF
eukprot:808046_1